LLFFSQLIFKNLKKTDPQLSGKSPVLKKTASGYKLTTWLLKIVASHFTRYVT